MGAMMQGWMGEQPGQPGGATPGAAGDHQDAHAQAQASASNAHASAHSAAQAAAQDAHSAAHAAAQAAQAAEEAFAAAGMPEGRGPLSSRLPRPTRQGRTSKTRLLVLKQQTRGLPLHLTMRNGLYSLTRNPRLRPLRSPSRCWTRR